MRFRFLGTGTSSGIPAIGCACAVCTSDDPRDSRLRTSGAFLFDDGRGQDRAVLVDAGPDLRRQALQAGLARLDAILFTHNHVDHTWGLDEVRRFNAVMRAPIDIYGDSHTLAFLRATYRHIFEKAQNINDSFVATLIAHEIRAGAAVELFGLRFEPVQLLHGRLPVLGFRVEGASDRTAQAGAGLLPLAYCTDVSAIPTESWARLQGLKTLVLDALRHRAHPTHFTLEQAVSVAERIGAERTWFVHMAHDLAHEATNATLPTSIRLAHDGLDLDGATGLPIPVDRPASAAELCDEPPAIS
ncbi:MAG: MBL fold metallo-hydrolase [Phycisphaeraceae bacterium]|nr:MBL fold metallo-hydrolase [Phycisphaeraceae bacterium]